MKKEIVTGERLGFNNLSQDLRDVFVHGLRKDDEGKFRQVLNSIAADSQRVSITDERGHFKPKTNEEIFTQLISLTAKAALFEADGGDTHSSEYYALIKKTDVDLTRKLESVWANRDRQVEVSESRVAAKAWGKSSVEKGAEAVIDDLLNRADKWVNLTLIDNLVAAYDNRLSKAAAGTVVVSEIVTLLAGCNPPPAEVQEIQSPQQISGVVTREILTKIAADPKNQEVAAYVKDDMDRILADFNGRFIPGTEMLYYIDNGGKMTRWVFGAEAREDGQMGVKVLGYCNDSDECQVVDKAFLTKEKDGAKVYGYVDEAGNSHGVIAYVGEDTYAFDYEGNSHSDNRDNGKNLLDAIMSIGVTSVQAAAEEPIVEPTVAATEIPEATAEPTKEVAFYEKNWGNFAKTLDAADVEKNGVIIPYNPIDNPEEFNKIIEEIKTEKDWNEGLGKINSEYAGTDPSIARFQIDGSVVIPFQVMYFKYDKNYYPFIISNGGKAVMVLDSIASYGEFVDRNVKGSEMTFLILTDPNNKIVSDFVSWGDLSKELQDIAVKTGFGIAFMRQKN